MNQILDKIISSDPFESIVLLFVAGMAATIYFAIRKKLNQIHNGNGDHKETNRRLSCLEGRMNNLEGRMDKLERRMDKMEIKIDMILMLNGRRVKNEG